MNPQDLPTTLPEGMVIGAITKREDPRDAVVVHPRFKSLHLKALPKGSLIGKWSLYVINYLYLTDNPNCCWLYKKI